MTHYTRYSGPSRSYCEMPNKDPLYTIEQALLNGGFDEPPTGAWPEGLSGVYEAQIMQYPGLADGFQLTVPYSMMHNTIDPTYTTVTPIHLPVAEGEDSHFQWQSGQPQVYLDDEDERSDLDYVNTDDEYVDFKEETESLTDHEDYPQIKQVKSLPKATCEIKKSASSSKPKSTKMPSWKHESGPDGGSVDDTEVDGRPFSYAQLIYQTLLKAPEHRMPLHEIYSHLLKNFARIQKKDKQGKGWMNSVRHNLSMNGGFMKIERTDTPKKSSKKSFIWVLSPEAIKGGVSSTTRYREQKPKSRRDNIKAVFKKDQSNKSDENDELDNKFRFKKALKSKFQPVIKTDNDDEHKKAVEQAILATAPPQNCNAAKMQSKKEKHHKMSFLSRGSRRQNTSARLESKTTKTSPTKCSEFNESAPQYEAVAQPSLRHPMYTDPPVAAPELTSYHPYYPDANNTDTSNDSVFSLQQQYDYQLESDYAVTQIPLAAGSMPVSFPQSSAGMVAFPLVLHDSHDLDAMQLPCYDDHFNREYELVTHDYKEEAFGGAAPEPYFDDPSLVQMPIRFMMPPAPGQPGNGTAWSQ